MLFLVKQQNEKEKKKEKGKGKVEDKMAKMNDASPTPFFLICWCLTFDVSVSFFFFPLICVHSKKKRKTLRKPAVRRFLSPATLLAGAQMLFH